MCNLKEYSFQVMVCFSAIWMAGNSDPSLHRVLCIDCFIRHFRDQDAVGRIPHVSGRCPGGDGRGSARLAEAGRPGNTLTLEKQHLYLKQKEILD